MFDKLRTLGQYIVPQKLLTGTMGALASQSYLHQQAIKWFISHYQVDMSQAEFSDPSHYQTFNDFFIRQLKDNARPIDDASTFVSPVDGMISQLGDIDNNRLIQAKGRDYTLLDLLAGDEQDATLFEQGQFMTLYLSPKDYHRVHMPCHGILKKMTYVPGKLFAVKPLTAENVPNLFARNERLIILFETENGPVAVVMVGAMIVGNMATTWHGTLKRQSSIDTWSYPEATQFNKGQELGHFKLGSTVILLTSQQCPHRWHDALSATDAIQMGQAL